MAAVLKSSKKRPFVYCCLVVVHITLLFTVQSILIKRTCIVASYSTRFMHIRVTVYCGYCIVTISLGCILYCGCFVNICTCVYCVLYCLYCVFYRFVYVYLFLFVLSVLVKRLLPPSDNSFAVSKYVNE